MTTIEFEFDSPHGKYKDAIVLFGDQVMTDAEIDAMKQGRFTRWLDLVSNPPEEQIEELVEEPTGEE
jgi:hypothetical protein